MRRAIYADDINNKMQQLDFGSLNVPIRQAVSNVVMSCPTAEIVSKPVDNKQHEVPLKLVVDIVRAFYEKREDRFNEDVEELIKQLWDSNFEVAEYLSGLRYNTNTWVPM